jgi:hypothetical protein
MMLCPTCSGIDICSSLPNSAHESFETNPYQSAESVEHSQADEDKVRHHDDIFRVRDSADGGCELCAIIFAAFESRKVKDEEIARGLPLVFTINENNKLIVSFESPEGLIELCGFDLYVHRGE